MDKYTFEFEHTMRSVQSVTLKVLTGHDEKNAKFRAQGGGADAFVEEMVSEAILAVDGNKVEAPFKGWLDWNGKTIDCLKVFFNELNAGTPEDVEGPLAKVRATIAGQELPASPTSDSEPPPAS